MKLVRTIKHTDIVYYWNLDDEKEANSPLFRTLDDAKEWMTRRFFALYDGPERRQSVIDRRHNFEHRNSRAQASTNKVSLNPVGRRMADQYSYTLVDRVSLVMDLLKSRTISPDALH